MSPSTVPTAAVLPSQSSGPTRILFPLRSIIESSGRNNLVKRNRLGMALALPYANVRACGGVEQRYGSHFEEFCYEKRTGQQERKGVPEGVQFFAWGGCLGPCRVRDRFVYSDHCWYRGVGARLCQPPTKA